MSRQDRIIALIRTGVPALVGALLAFVIAHVPVVATLIVFVNAQLVTLGFAGVSVSVILQTALVGLTIAGYYWVARQLGRRWPAAEKWLLGHSATPTYEVMHNGVANAGATSTAPPVAK